ncbi:MAG TPA: hypothetical protein PK052_06870 [Anaerohalosphaeraceae bacterium]|nr:hypothetical protein [Anaerohalosphaeraceae bacterium]HOL31689.1 hypothetical protein [Anaerohalosphaeraceae bacterium]
MAVTRITEDWKALGINTEVSLTGASGTMTRRFIVEFDKNDAPARRPILALTASHGGVTIPDYWEVHPASNDFFVRRKSVAPDGGPTVYAVAVEYEYIEDPLSRHYTVQFVPQATQEAIDKAIEGKPEAFTKELTNSAKEPFDPPILEEFYDVSIVIKRNEAAFDIQAVTPYLNTVNADNFSFIANNGVTYQFSAGKVLCKSIQAEEQRHGPNWYFVVTYEFVVRNDGWKRRILDQGFRQLVNGVYATIKDEEGNALTQPAKLNGSGAVLAPDDAPVFLEFQTKYSKNFAAFGFA